MIPYAIDCSTALMQGCRPLRFVRVLLTLLIPYDVIFKSDRMALPVRRQSVRKLLGPVPIHVSRSLLQFERYSTRVAVVIP